MNGIAWNFGGLVPAAAPGCTDISTANHPCAAPELFVIVGVPVAPAVVIVPVAR
jgi:hypothetical protein